MIFQNRLKDCFCEGLEKPIKIDVEAVEESSEFAEYVHGFCLIILDACCC